jgi:hypothetical protein
MDALSRLQELRKMPYQLYLESSEWQERRRQALLGASGKCQLCGKGEALHVHHRTYDRRGMELPSDLTALCAVCHGNYHGKSQSPVFTMRQLRLGITSTTRAIAFSVKMARAKGTEPTFNDIVMMGDECMEIMLRSCDEFLPLNGEIPKGFQP